MGKDQPGRTRLLPLQYTQRKQQREKMNAAKRRRMDGGERSEVEPAEQASLHHAAVANGIANTGSDDDGDGVSQDLTPLENCLSFNDTCIALRLMRAQFPIIHKVTIRPFVLRSQLYSSIKDRTQVDRDLESLKREKVVRVFKLSTGQDDHAIMFTDDYLGQMEFSMKRLKPKNQSDMQVFEWFRIHVMDAKLDVSIGHDELCSLLSLGGKVKDMHVTLLINAGLLTRQLIDPNMYWFAIPNIGFVLKGLSQGRKELLSLLNRTKYKEMPLATLEKKQLRLSLLDTRFHIRDLIGSGHLKTHSTPSGLVVRITRD